MAKKDLHWAPRTQTIKKGSTEKRRTASALTGAADSDGSPLKEEQLPLCRRREHSMVFGGSRRKIAHIRWKWREIRLLDAISVGDHLGYKWFILNVARNRFFPECALRGQHLFRDESTSTTANV